MGIGAPRTSGLFAMVPRRSRLVLCTVLTLVAMACVPALAHAAAGWQSGPLVESADNNCITGDVEYEAGSYLSYYTDPANPPKSGDVYYVAIDVTGIGNTCAGIYGDVNMILPANTSLAISSQHPVLCYLGFPGASSYTRDTTDCPQSPGLGIHGYSFDPVHANPPFWPLPQGGTVEIQVPVVSSSAGVQQFEGAVQLADGEFDPTLAPTLLAIVNPAAASTGGPTGNHIGIYYQTPSISGQSQPVANGAVSVTYTGWVQNNSNDGSVVAEFAKADSAGDCNNPSHVFTTSSAALQHPNTEVNGNFTGMYPGGAYCWRFVVSVPFGVANGTYYGNWQYFATIGDYISANPNDPNKPPPAKPLDVAQCSSNGSGCATSNCNAGATCTTGGGVSGLSHALRIALGGSGRGAVRGPGGISCPGTCSRSYPLGTSSSVTLTATPTVGSTFTGWSGGGCSGTATCTVKMSADQSVTATFSLPPARCSLSAPSRSVPLKKTRHGGRVGTLIFKVTCNQAANISLTGVLVEKLSKTHSKRVHLGPVRGSVRPGTPTSVSLKLPGTALKGLKHRLHESLALSLSATNVNGAGRASLSIGTLKHSG